MSRVYLRRRPTRRFAQGAAIDFYTLLLERKSGNLHSIPIAGRLHEVRRCYHHIEVRPQTIGRVLGVGMRVAGRLAGQAIMGEGQQKNAAAPNAQPGAPPASAADRGRVAGQTTRGVARGLGGFFKPFRSVGGKIWLEVTGVFFLLPVLVFSPVLWRTRASWQQGPDHRTFLSSAVLVTIFLYLGVSSFWRAGRKR
jgi:hypothetical protein